MSYLVKDASNTPFLVQVLFLSEKAFFMLMGSL